MTAFVLTKKTFHQGVWYGELTLSDPSVTVEPDLAVTHRGEPLEGLVVSAKPGQANAWDVRFPLPTERLTDGAETFVFVDQASSAKLGHFSVLAGEAMSDDVTAELDLMRAELDMLKAAFRAHVTSQSDS